MLGFSYKPESVAPAAFPAGADSSLCRISCCPLHHVHDCLVIQESDLVENKDGQQGKQAEVFQQLSCTTRAWRKPPRDFPHGKGLTWSLGELDTELRTWAGGFLVTEMSGALNSSLLLQAQGLTGLTLIIGKQLSVTNVFKNQTMRDL